MREKTTGTYRDIRKYDIGTGAHLKLAALLLLGVVSITARAQMTVPGQFAVSEGAATYTIPIRLPSGVSGPQPGLALNYSSQAGNGLVGVGWSLSGLSSITRCPRTVAQDGIRGAVNYDLNDRYCLNGQRLFSISGADGANSAEYRTERESFSKVISYTEAGVVNGPAYFVLKTSDGLTMEYGRSVDSRIELYGKPTVIVDEWLLNKVQDTRGNYYSVAYQKNTNGALGGYVVDAIGWGGNFNSGTPHPHSIRFSHELRSDKVMGYSKGSPKQNTTRLSKIAVFGNFSLLWDYRITYGEAVTSGTYRSLLNSVQECNSTGACKPAIEVDYRAASDSSFAFTSSTWPIVYLQPTDQYFWTGDFNGDGLSDIASCQHAGAVHVKLSTGTGFTNDVWAVDGNWGGAQWTWTGDFNGDGKTDIASISGGSAYMKLSTATGNGFLSETWAIDPTWSLGWIWRGDFNGDGKTDIATAIGGNVYMKLSTGSGFRNEVWPVANLWSTEAGNPQPLYTWTGDFNGDGLTDIASADGYNVFMKLSTGTGFVSETWRITGAWGGAGYFWVADFNGDGLDDIASGCGAVLCMKISTGSGFVSESWAVDNTWGNASRTLIGDFNGDGLPDISSASASGSEIYLKLSTGSGMKSLTLPISSEWAHPTSTWVGDFDGDGRSDLASWAYGNIFMKLASIGPFDRAINFSTDLTNSIRPSYGSLSRLIGSSYQKTVVPTFPVVTQASSMSVVTSVRSSNGVGGDSTTQYTYGNLLAELGPAGRGSLGFEWTQSQNMQTGSVSRTYYRQDWPYLGLVREAGTGTGVGPVETNWKNLTHTVNTGFTCRAATGSGAWAPCATPSPNTRYFIYPNQIDTRAWEYTGMMASDGVFIALPRTRTTQSLNDYGEVTQLKTETLNPDGSASGHSKTTTNTYAPVDPAKWYLNRLVRSTVTATSP